MKFAIAVDHYIRDQRAYGRINSKATEVSYRSRLRAHAEDVGKRDPRKTGREDVKRTLRRWTHPNTQRQAHAVLTSFYDWMMEEGYRTTNPARAVRRARRRKPEVYRLTREEARRMLEVAADDRRERWTIELGLCIGARNQELRGLQGRHFRRPGFVWISADIAKGHKERWVPVIDDLQRSWQEIALWTADDEFVIPARRWLNPPVNTRWRELAKQSSSSQAVWRLVRGVAGRAGLSERVTPHTLRHAFGDHVTRHAGLKAAQALLGHEDVSTTEGTYTGEVTLDELTISLHGFSYRALSARGSPETPGEATTGIEPVESASNATKGSGSPGGRDGPDDVDGPACRAP